MKTWPLKFPSGNLEHKLVDIGGKVLSKAFILHIKISRRGGLASLNPHFLGTLYLWLSAEHNI